jgi:hypothetical protein
MKELYLPTVDHFEPTVEDALLSSYRKISRHWDESTYTSRHGHGRGAACLSVQRSQYRRRDLE